MPNFQNDPVVSVSDSISTPAVQGEGSRNEGIRGVSHSAYGGVVGINDSDYPSDPRLLPVSFLDDSRLIKGGPGGWFESNQGEGVRGWSKNPHHGGVVGVNTAGGFGVYGQSDDGAGVVGESKSNAGIYGTSHNVNNGGVIGVNTAGGIGVNGTSNTGVAVWGTSRDHEAIHGETHSAVTAAIAAYQKNTASNSAALYAKHDGHGTAAFFDGNVLLTGHIQFENAADCAEDFDISAGSIAEPGTVMALDDEGNLRESCHAYDKRVAGVISGAGNYKPGLVLDKQQSQSNRKPIALLGKVFCKVDAQFGPIEVGDLLTTSPTVGHAMRADDPFKAFGAVIGKALRPLANGQGLIPILIALQ